MRKHPPYGKREKAHEDVRYVRSFFCWKIGRIPSWPFVRTARILYLREIDAGLSHHEKVGGGFKQAYKAQAGVDTDSLLIVANTTSQHLNAKQQLATDNYIGFLLSQG